MDIITNDKKIDLLSFKIIKYCILVGFICLVACSKKYVQNAAPSLHFELTDQAKILINKSWHEKSVEVVHHDLDSSQVMNITQQFLNTDLDDVVIFSQDGSYQYDEGETKSRNDSQQVYENGNWYLAKDHLVLVTHNSRIHYQVKELSLNTLVLKLFPKQENYHYVITYEPL